jgi:hypothetical protein
MANVKLSFEANLVKLRPSFLKNDHKINIRSVIMKLIHVAAKKMSELSIISQMAHAQ